MIVSPAILGAILRTSEARGELQHHWDFLEGSGSVAHDDVGLLDASFQGTPTFDSDVPTVLFEGATDSLLFDGSTDYLTIPQATTAWDTTSAQTLVFWVKADAIGGVAAANEFPTIISLTSDQSESFTIWLNDTHDSVNSDGLNFGFQGLYDKNVSTSATFLGNWVHVAIVYDGVSYNSDSSYTIYVNGVSQGITASGAPPAHTEITQIGKGTTTTSFFDGRLFDIRVYNKALTSGEVSALDAGYNNLWEGADDSWNTASNWPLNGVPTSDDAVLFDSTDNSDCLVDINRPTVYNLTIAASYTGTFTMSSFFTVTNDFSHLSTAGTVLYPQTLLVGGDCDIDEVLHQDNIKDTTIEMNGSTAQTLTLPDTASIVIDKLIINSGGTVTLAGTLTQVKLNRLEVSLGELAVASKYLTITGDLDVIGGTITGLSTATAHTVGGSARLYGSSKTSLLDLGFASATEFNVADDFFIRNATVGNLNASGTGAQCLNCVEA